MKSRIERHQPHIDGLRAIAVIAVIMFHLDIDQFKGGFIGVDVFFVISGFLITRLIRDEITDTGGFRFGRFYLRRVRRLAPALAATLTLSTAAAVLLLSTGLLKAYGSELIASLLSSSNMLFWQQADYFDVASKLKPLLHTWSLSVEEQFYLVWPALVCLAFAPRTRRFAPWVLAAVAIASFAANYPFSRGVTVAQDGLASAFSNGRATIFYLLPFRAFELAIGAMLLFVPRPKAPRRGLHDGLFLFGGLLIGLSVLTFSDQLLFPAHWALFPCIGAALMIYSGGDARSRILVANPVAVGIGKISYSLYLVHWPLIVFWLYCRGTPGWQAKVALGASMALLGYLGWRFIETPFREQRLRLRYVAIPSVALLVAGIAMAWSNGWAWRCSNPLQFNVSGSAQDFHRSYYGGIGYQPGFVGKPTKPAEIVLLGDSHGAHYAHGLNVALAEPFGCSMYICAGPSYLHLPGLGRVSEGFNRQAFAQNDVPALRKILSDSPVAPIFVISQSWLFQQSIADRLDEFGERMHAKVSLGDLVDGIVGLKQMFGVKHLVVIGEVPGAGLNCFEELTRPALSQRFEPSQIATRDLPEAVADFNSRMSNIAKQTAAFEFFDPSEALCVSGRCRNMDDLGRPIYSDPYHLSTFGSQLVISHFAPRLKELLDMSRSDRACEASAEICRPIETAKITPELGYCYIAKVDCEVPGDRVAASSVTVWEDGIKLGPPHQVHRDIRAEGGGRFSYWVEGVLYFSTTDNSDPRTNGRRYQIRWPR